MGKVQPLHPTEPTPASFPSAPRATLAALIEQGGIAQRNAGEALTALGRANKGLAEAKARLSEARHFVATAKEAHAANAAQAATSGSAPVPDRSLREARTREVEAQDDLEATQAAVVVLEEVVNRAKQVTGRAEGAIAIAARAVLAAEVPRLLAAAQALQEKTIVHRLALIALVRDLKIYGDFPGPGTEDVTRFLKFETDLPAGTGGVNYRDWDAHPAGAPWKAAFAALMNDAAAPFPEA